MKNKKGFTLIELLATAVILAIIVFIVVPAITKTIETTKNKANLRSLEGHIKNIENSLAVEKISNRTLSGNFNFDALELKDFSKKDKIRCNEYTISENTVLEANDCLINEKNYCYNGSKALECETHNVLLNKNESNVE